MRLQADISEPVLIWCCLIAMIGNEAHARTSVDSDNADQTPIHFRTDGKPGSSGVDML